MKHIIICLIQSLVLSAFCQVSSKDNTHSFLHNVNDIALDIRMPNVTPIMNDQYFCVAMKVDFDEAYITRFEPQAKSSRAHHMILFGSTTPSSQMFPDYWDCVNNMQIGLKILFAWANNAPPVSLPEDVGFRIGENTENKYLVLQVHYAKPLKVSDNSGLKLLMKVKQQKYRAGIFIMADSFTVIPPEIPKFHVDVSCTPSIEQPMYVFAYRVHAHSLGSVIVGYKFNTQNGTFDMLAKGNPKWPQAFYPMDKVYKVTQNDILITRCTYNSTQRSSSTHMGRGTSDEMCNLYFMYYTEEVDKSAPQPSMARSCSWNMYPKLVQQLPEENDTPLPPNPNLEEMAENNELVLNDVQPASQDISITKKGHSDSLDDSHDNHLSSDYDDLLRSPAYDDNFQYKEVVGWPMGNLTLGQVTAVTVNSEGNVVLFHRGSHVWNGGSFDIFDHYQPVDEGPISEFTVITLDSTTGHVLHKWGSNRFYLPHGLSIDSKGFAWLTDVALHQVFKFPEKGSKTADLILGERFMPGRDNQHFCKPTSVAVTSNGDFYVADGYCNFRIVQFSEDGKYISQWGRNNPAYRGRPSPPPAGSFLIPHKVILAEGEELVCVADRENGRVQCFTRSDQNFAFAIQREEFHGRLFSIASTQEKGGLLFSVCGSSVTSLPHPVAAFVFNLTTKALLNVITPRLGTFSQPHDLAISSDAESVYVAEIGPNKIWKFEKATHKSGKKVLPATGPALNSEEASLLQSTEHPPLPPPPPPAPHMGLAVLSSTAPSAPIDSANKKSGVVAEASNFATSMVIMALLGIPILLLVLITVIVRLRKRGRFQQCSLPQVKGWLGGYRTPHGSHEKFNIGSLLNPHKGFDRVALDESDLDVEDKSDSDVEEFNAAAATTRKA